MIRHPSITFSSLRMLKISFGYNKLQQYDYAQSISNNSKFLELYLNPFMNYWMTFLFICTPIIVAICLKIKEILM